MKRTIQNWLLACVAMLSGCGSDPEPSKSDKDYFPLRKGFYQIYSVDQTVYNIVDPPASSSYELMLDVVDSFPDNSGTYTYVIYRSKRADESSAWEYIDTWSAKVDERRVLVSEGSVSYVKLAFPTRKGRKWDGNAFNSLGEDQYEIVNAGTPFTVGSLNFDDCVEVVQEDNDDVIVYFDQRKEVYARDVGLISKEIKQLKYCTVGPCLGQQIIDEGIIFSQKIKEYGVH